MSTSKIIITLIFVCIVALEIPIVVIVSARAGLPETRRRRVATSLSVVIVLTALVAAILLPTFIH